MKSPFSKPAGNVPRMSQLGAGSEIPTGAGILDRFISQLTFMLAIVIGIYIYNYISIYIHISLVYIYIHTNRLFFCLQGSQDWRCKIPWFFLMCSSLLNCYLGVISVLLEQNHVYTVYNPYGSKHCLRRYG